MCICRFLDSSSGQPLMHSSLHYNQNAAKYKRNHDRKHALKRASEIVCVCDELETEGHLLYKTRPPSTARKPCCLSCFLIPTCQESHSITLTHSAAIYHFTSAEELLVLKQNSNHFDLLCIRENVRALDTYCT